MTKLCKRYGVTRPTGYKWISRSRELGAPQLEDRSRAPLRCPHRRAPRIVALILSARKEYGWGAKKLLQVLAGHHSDLAWPAGSTVNDILERRGLLRKNRRRRKWKHPGAAPLRTERPNQVWPADFKVQFKTAGRRYCYPLTITDRFSRALLACRGLPSVKTEDAKPVRTLFREVEMPEAIRTDNGASFASTGIHGLCELNVWWMQHGIVHQRIPPSNPQENGSHERMHRELNRDTMRPANQPPISAAPIRFVPKALHRRETRRRNRRSDSASLWKASPRLYVDRITPPDYPALMEIRRVSHCGSFRVHHAQPLLSNALRDQQIGLEEVDDGIWNIVYYNTCSGRSMRGPY